MRQYQTINPPVNASPEPARRQQRQAHANILTDHRSAQPAATTTPNILIDNRPVAQLTRWTWNGSKWTPDDVNADFSKKPTFAGKKHGQVFDDSPQQEEEKEGPAAIQKRQTIQPYLDLLTHLAGEAQTGGKKNKVIRVTGGHLLTAMRNKWGNRLAVATEANDNAVWHAQWSIDGVEKNGGSSMFPASWTVEDLRHQLLASNVVGQTVILQPSGITLTKKGSTFYPNE